MDIHGHRGARGLEPENTLVGFAAALDIGVDFLEADVGLSADGVMVVHHDPRLNPDITRGPDGGWLEPPTPVLHETPCADLAAYDVGCIRAGTAYRERFPDQACRDGIRIPRLADLCALVRERPGCEARLNVEVKSSPESPRLHAVPERYAEVLVDTLSGAGCLDRTMVQSFDWRVLEAVRRLAPDTPIACLTSEGPRFDTLRRSAAEGSAWTAGLRLADFDGDTAAMVAATGAGMWTPYFADLDARSLASARRHGLGVAVWTVNETAGMREFADMGVDGIITDYPDRLRAVLPR